MTVKLYADVHVRRVVVTGLRLRGVDILTAQEDGAAQFDDSRLLDRARELSRVLFTQDDDLLKEAARRQEIGEGFAGLVYVHQLNITIGECIEDLQLIALTTELEDWANRVTYLPLK